jgi:putative endonuclease
MLQGAGGRFYTGITTDSERRVQQHNGFLKGGAKSTRANRPWKLVYTERAKTKGEALRRELAIKKLSHQSKLRLVYG